jgi:hypothetical protein
VQIHLPALPVIANGRAAKGMQMGFISGRHLQCRRVHLDKITRSQPAANARLNAVARHQRWAAVGMAAGVPPIKGNVGFHLAISHKMR